MRILAATSFFLILGSGLAMAQATPPPAPAAEDPKSWSFSAAAYAYIVPDSRDYIQPTITADHGLLHLEGRYNYEALETGSAWIGAGFSGGETLKWEITPMVGGVFGKTYGVAPGYKGSLSWWKLSLYSEGEYVRDAEDVSDSFFYNWSELTLEPFEGFRFGFVAQRTKAYETDRDVQRGVLVGYTFERVSLTAYVFNPDESRPVVVISLGIDF